MTSMLNRIQPSPAFVLALIALVVAMSGTAVAAGLAIGSVKSKHIANGQVKAPDIAAAAVRGEEVQDGSLSGADVQDGTVAGPDVADGSLNGADVADGSLDGADVQDGSLTGADVDESSLQGLMAARVRTVVTQTAALQGPAEIVAQCAPIEKAIGGGGAWIIAGFQDGNVATSLEAPITASMPAPAAPSVDGHSGWRVHGRNLSGVDRALRAYAVCVPRQP